VCLLPALSEYKISQRDKSEGAPSAGKIEWETMKHSEIYNHPLAVSRLMIWLRDRLPDKDPQPGASHS